MNPHIILCLLPSHFCKLEVTKMHSTVLIFHKLNKLCYKYFSLLECAILAYLHYLIGNVIFLCHTKYFMENFVMHANFVDNFWKKYFKTKGINHPVQYRCAREIVEKWGLHLPEKVINYRQIYECDVKTFDGPASMDKLEQCGKIRECGKIGECEKIRETKRKKYVCYSCISIKSNN